MNFRKFFYEQLPDSDSPKTLLAGELVRPGNFPRDLYLARELTQNKFHAETLFEHLADSYEIGLLYKPDPVFAMICLFHDIGKVSTKTWDKVKQDYTFHRHEYVGAKLIGEWMFNQRFCEYDLLRVTSAIRHHQYRIYPDTQPKTIRRWLKTIGQQGWEDVRILRLVERMANQANKHKPVIYKKYIECDNRINLEAQKIWSVDSLRSCS